ncbi:hypothetical protein F5B22DRAFT_639984 [Xylaria bambusicola]|uniref:uncharacterized protein n=1 Tax=Xylaria bambusicola TaxID=326684 RepID=UPI002008DB86|nr:uncharacterized protein F5B22DRAFT_639984 [Xylaria bambusicola]KAI0505316.1 hypothetical protein F5B22DRAFT_639984 [Xylaria bambusicola]
MKKKENKLDSPSDEIINSKSSLRGQLTYVGELNPSFSANCNVLSLLLSRDDGVDFIPQITKIVTFLANKAFNGNIKDKWQWVLGRYLRNYILAVLALSSMVKLPFVRQLDKGQIISKMAVGKSFLYANRDKWAKGEHIWIEKVTYSSDILSEACCLAASLVPIPFIIEPEPAAAISPSLAGNGFLVPEKLLIGMRKAGSLIAHTPLFRTTQPSTLRIAEMQACFAMQDLQQRPLYVFPRTAKGKDKYTFVVPLALTPCAESQGCSTSLFVLYGMMVLSILLNFRADEYMEGAFEKNFTTDLDSIRRLVKQPFTDFQPKVQNVTATNGNGVSTKQHYQSSSSFNNDLPTDDVLSRFLRQILEHPAVQLCPGRLQARLAFDLQTFLLSHVTQAEDNIRLRAASRLNGSSTLQNKSDACNRPGRSFYRWIRDVSADHTSCPYSFVFLECLVHATLSNPSPYIYQMRTNPHALAGARAAYLAEDACRHLASLCRMYNDYGSQARDAEEQTLNSLDFPEFSRGIKTPIPGQDTTMSFSSSLLSAPEKAKAELLWIAEYERRGLETAMKLLAEELGPGELIDALEMLVDVTDLYGQIYAVKDIGTRTR